MPLTIITLKSVPRSLRGDLSKWMQEIATGVYIGNFNTKIREKLWNRVKESVKEGEATITYAYRNEIGYNFDTINTQRKVIDYDGLPLVMIPSSETNAIDGKLGFSKAAKFRKAQKYSKKSQKTKNTEKASDNHLTKAYVVIDIETDGLDVEKNAIIELGAYKVDGTEKVEFQCFIEYEGDLPKTIINLTSITEEILASEGKKKREALKQFVEFIGDYDLIGYSVDFDLRFINHELRKEGLPLLKNKRYDLMKYVKKEKMFLGNYKLQTVLKEYGIDEDVPHRALLDAKLIYELSTKVNKFREMLERK